MAEAQSETVVLVEIYVFLVDSGRDSPFPNSTLAPWAYSPVSSFISTVLTLKVSSFRTVNNSLSFKCVRCTSTTSILEREPSSRRDSATTPGAVIIIVFTIKSHVAITTRATDGTFVNDIFFPREFYNATSLKRKTNKSRRGEEGPNPIPRTYASVFRGCLSEIRLFAPLSKWSGSQKLK